MGPGWLCGQGCHLGALCVEEEVFLARWWVGAGRGGMWDKLDCLRGVR